MYVLDMFMSFAYVTFCCVELIHAISWFIKGKNLDYIE